MSSILTSIYASVYFYSFAAILVAFFWDYTRVPKWFFLLCAIISRFIVTNNGWIYDIFSFVHLPQGFAYSVICLVLATILLVLLVRVPFVLIIYAVFTTSLYAFFMKGMDLWFFSPSSFWQLSNQSMLISASAYALFSLIICILIRSSIVPLFRTCPDKRTWISLAIPSLIGSLSFWLLFINAESMERIPSTVYIGSLLLFITLLLSNISGINNIRTLLKAAEYEAAAKTSNELLKLQKEHYLQLSDSIKETRMARHDLRHHIHTISGLVEQGNYVSLKEYLLQYEDTLPDVLIFTRHPGVDAVLGHLLSYAKSESIDVIYKNLSIPEKCSIKDTELTILFGNCIENAIEASLSLPKEKRYIKIYSSIQGNFLALVFENAYADPILEKDQQLLSHKRDNKEAGTGLQSVKQIAKQYHGSLELHYDGQTFHAMILLQYQ